MVLPDLSHPLLYLHSVSFAQLMSVIAIFDHDRTTGVHRTRVASKPEATNAKSFSNRKPVEVPQSTEFLYEVEDDIR